MDSLTSFWDAVTTFIDAVGDVSLSAVVIALVFHSINLALRSVAWRNVIRAGLGGIKIPIGPVSGGLVAGAGLNGIVPARGGDVLKLFLVRMRLHQTSYPMLASSLVAETLFNAVISAIVFMWAWQSGRLPSGPELPGSAAFELSWAAQHPFLGMVIVALVVTALASLVFKYRRQLAERWHEVVAGVRILRSPRVYVRTVVIYQAAAWIAQVTTAWFFLDAFGIEPSVEAALTVVLIQAFGTALLVTPGGVGPKQALTVVLFAGQASNSTILAFSVGMEATIVGFQLAIGIPAAAKMMGGLRFREVLRRARAERNQVSTESISA